MKKALQSVQPSARPESAHRTHLEQSNNMSTEFFGADESSTSYYLSESFSNTISPSEEEDEELYDLYIYEKEQHDADSPQFREVHLSECPSLRARDKEFTASLSDTRGENAAGSCKKCGACILSHPLDSQKSDCGKATP